MIKIDEKQPLRGEPGHWRYEKDKLTEGKESKATTIETMEKEEKQENPKQPKDKAYSKTAAKDMKRSEQVKILNDRKIKVFSTDKEEVLIKKILKSNP